MDFIVSLPSFHDYIVIMVVVDGLSKYCHFTPLKAYYLSKSIIENFMHSILRLHICQNQLYLR